MLVALAFGLGGCLGTGDPMPAETVGPHYVVGGGELQYGDTIISAMAIHEHKGKMAACGVWTVRDGTALGEGMHRYFVESAILRVDGRNRINNLAFARRVDYSENLSGESANCVMTGTPWRPDFASAEVEVVFPRQSLGAGEMEDTKYRLRAVPIEDLTR